jgi:ParB-like chromosome segregation protein Spo0J
MSEIRKLYDEVEDLRQEIADKQEEINDTDDREEQASLREEKADLVEDLESKLEEIEELWEQAQEDMAAAPYQVLPPLTAKELEDLKASILEQGVLVPVDVDEDGVILDGHHRAMVAEALGVDCPRRVVAGLVDDGARRAYAVKVNITRRHLTQKARQELLGKLRAEGWSIRRIEAETGIPKSTVARDLAESPVPGGTPAVVVGEDGKSYPAHREQPLEQPDRGSVPAAAEAIQRNLRACTRGLIEAAKEIQAGQPWSEEQLEIFKADVDAISEVLEAIQQQLRRS